MPVERETSRCPLCKEQIAAGAIRCKHCHADLARTKSHESPLSNLNTFRTGFLSGILFTLILSVLAYLQFYRP